MPAESAAPDIAEQLALAQPPPGLILEQLPQSIVTTDLAGRVTYWSRGAEKMFGYQAAEAMGRPLAVLYLEEDPDKLAPAILEARRDGQAEVELRIRRQPGEDRRIRFSLSLLRNDSYEAYGLLGVGVEITAERQAEQALRESEERYRCLADAMPQAAYITDAQGKTKLLNRPYQDYTDARGGESADVDWQAWVHPDDIPGLQERWRTCAETGECFEAEYRVRNANGEYRWHLARSVPVRAAGGEILHWVGTSTDIHALKCAEQALRRSEERFRLASQALGGIVYDWAPQTGAVERSGDLRKIIGLPVEETEPAETWWQERVHPEDTGKSARHVLQRLGGDQSSFETEFRIRQADGHWLDVCDRGYVVRDAKGTPVRVVGSTQDISARKQLERQINETNARLKFQADILATTDDAIIAIDPSRIVTYLSPGAERLYGVKSADALGKPLSTVHGYGWLDPDDEKRCWSDLAERGTWKGEYIHIHNDGRQLIVSSTVNMLAQELGGGMVAVIRDVSEKKRAELAVQKQAAELARANDDLMHFAYAVSHDLQAPLRTVVSFSQLLALKCKSSLDAQGGDFLRLIVEAGTRMSAMIRDLLALATCAGEQVYQEVLLDEVLTVALENLESEVRASDAVVTSDSLPRVVANHGQLAQLFQNLIGNSLKYRKPESKPEIHVSAERAGPAWVIRFRDNGIGFEAKYADAIFGVFKRLHVSEYSGTGVGLAICKRIVERRGGSIWAIAAPGEGALFSFSVPDEVHILASEDQPAKTSMPQPPVGHPPASGEPFDELFQTLDLAQAMVRDMEGKVLIWTRGAERLFQWPKSEALGCNLHHLLRTEFPQPFQEIETELYTRGEWQGQLKKFRQDGSVLWVASQWSLYLDGSGRGRSVIEVDNDITALKEAEEALARGIGQRA